MACGIEITSPRLRGALVARFTTISARSAWSRSSLFIGLMTTALSIPVLPALAAKHPIPKHLSAKAFLKSIYRHSDKAYSDYLPLSMRSLASTST